MPVRSFEIGGQHWDVYPSGYITQYTQDEYALMFTRGSGSDREIRVTRYSPQGSRSKRPPASWRARRPLPARTSSRCSPRPTRFAIRESSP